MSANITERYLGTECTYDFWLRPNDVPDLTVAQQKGLNCVVLAHLILKDLFGYELPSELRCTEMFLDTEHFTRTDLSTTELQEGDLVWFGRPATAEYVDAFVPEYNEVGHLQNWQAFPVNHVGIYLGSTSGNQPEILHSVAGENTTIWSLDHFTKVPKYQTNWGVSRLVAASVS